MWEKDFKIILKGNFGFCSLSICVFVRMVGWLVVLVLCV